MGTYLLAVSVGPVQEFIAAARRTRDLWFGSHLLSEVSREVAKEISKYGELIFPESATAENVANVILAELREGATPATVTAEAKGAAVRRWRGFAEPVLNEFTPIINKSIWDGQVDDVIEFYAAWVPVRPNEYRDDRARVMRLLAGRKSCRDFIPADGRPGVPKSSLDGARETVLKEPGAWREQDRRRLRVRTGEQLDVVGLVKRVGEGTKRYPSVARVAADPWLAGCDQTHAELLADVRTACAALRGEGVRDVDTSSESGQPHYGSFPFEGTVVFRSRNHELWEETQRRNETLEQSRQKFRGLEAALSELVRAGGEPNPYLAVIVADGDQVGKALSHLTTADQHRKFSAVLAAFARQARDIVRRHRGVLIYSGGDDVLAFAPVNTCLDCARELHDQFGESLSEFATEGIKPTLSVGVSIAHFMENLEDLRRYGKQAEEHAKEPDKQGVKDGLAVHLHKRGGAPIKVRDRWGTKPDSAIWWDAPDTRITDLAAMLHEKLLPTRLATDLNRLVDVYAAWPHETDIEKSLLESAIRADVSRVIQAKKTRSGDDTKGRLAGVLSRVQDTASLRQLATELLVARQIATACRQAGGGS